MRDRIINWSNSEQHQFPLVVVCKLQNLDLCRILRLKTVGIVKCRCDFFEDIDITNDDEVNRAINDKDRHEWSTVDTDLFALTDGYRFCLISYCDRCDEYQFANDSHEGGDRTIFRDDYSFPPTLVGDWEEYYTIGGIPWKNLEKWLESIKLNLEHLSWIPYADFKVK
jgi:hypothetical protein